MTPWLYTNTESTCNGDIGKRQGYCKHLSATSQQQLIDVKGNASVELINECKGLVMELGAEAAIRAEWYQFITASPDTTKC